MQERWVKLKVINDVSCYKASDIMSIYKLILPSNASRIMDGGTMRLLIDR